WTKTNWTACRQAHGWTGGKESTLFSILKRRSKSSCQQQWRNLPRSGRTPGVKEIGSAATNFASGFPPSAGTCATPRTAQNSRGVLQGATAWAAVDCKRGGGKPSVLGVIPRKSARNRAI